MVRPSPMLIATWALVGRAPPAVGSEENRNSSAPGVWAASSTEIAAPMLLSSKYCCQEPSCSSTPARPADQRTSSEQSKTFGSGLSKEADGAPKTYLSPSCAQALDMKTSSADRSAGASPPSCAATWA